MALPPSCSQCRLRSVPAHYSPCSLLRLVLWQEHHKPPKCTMNCLSVLLNHLYASTNASTPFGKKLTVVNMLFYFHSLQMPDTRTLTLTLSDGTYKPANTLFTDIATCTASGEYLLLDFPQVCYD